MATNILLCCLPDLQDAQMSDIRLSLFGTTRSTLTLSLVLLRT